MAETGVRLRLKGLAGDAMRTFVLPIGDATVGSAAGNHVVLPLPGVSRQHALLRPKDGTVEVSDVDSKNGVYVNGIRVSHATLAIGDEVRFGPVSLRLEAIEERDVELAVALGGADGGPVVVEGPAAATGTWDKGSTEWLPLLEELVPHFRAGPRGLGDALALFVEDARLQGCCMAEIHGRSLVVIGAAGTVGVIDETGIVDAMTAGRREARLISGTDPGDPAVVWCGLAEATSHVLIAWARPDAPPVEPALRVLVQLVAWADPGQESPGATAAAARPLVFPARHVRGTSEAMADLYARMMPIADTNMPALIMGETGTGKEDVARALHLSSSRAHGPFVAVNCAAIPSELLEAELFGVGKGAATGVAPRPGRFQLAHGGTLFLDEIGDMPLGLQAKLLRVLETREVEPLAAATVVVDIRVVSATHVDVAGRIEAGQFRADLYYRLCGALLVVPPLRRRRGDIPSLVDGILRPLAVSSAKRIRGVTAKALAALVDYDWPGNVRELQHELQRLFHACPPGEAIEHGMLPEAVRAAPSRPAPAESSLELHPHVEALEDRLIQEALRRTAGNRTEAARLLGISRNGLAQKMTRLGLAP